MNLIDVVIKQSRKKKKKNCWPAAIRRSNQLTVLSKWLTISGSAAPSKSSSTNRSWKTGKKTSRIAVQTIWILHMRSVASPLPAAVWCVLSLEDEPCAPWAQPDDVSRTESLYLSIPQMLPLHQKRRAAASPQTSAEERERENEQRKWEFSWADMRTLTTANLAHCGV